jgi:hypothetical protein
MPPVFLAASQVSAKIFRVQMGARSMGQMLAGFIRTKPQS